MGSRGKWISISWRPAWYSDFQDNQSYLERLSQKQNKTNTCKPYFSKTGWVKWTPFTSRGGKNISLPVSLLCLSEEERIRRGKAVYKSCWTQTCTAALMCQWRLLLTPFGLYSSFFWTVNWLWSYLWTLYQNLLILI